MEYDNPSGELIPRRFRQFLYHRECMEIVVPIRFAGNKNMSGRSDGDITIKASGGNHQKIASHLDIGKCGSTYRTERLAVLR
jgi:hypothetical protein